MKLINLKNKYYINTDYISFIEANSKIKNINEINQFNKMLNTMPSKIFGADWMYTLKIPIHTNDVGIGCTYTYIEAENADQCVKDLFYKKFRELLIQRGNLKLPVKQYITEYTIHFVNTNDVITDIFEPEDLSNLGVIINQQVNDDTDEYINFFGKFD